MKHDHAFFKDTKSLDGSVVHSGDNRSGGDGVRDDEQISVDLMKVSKKINTLVFVVNVFDKGCTFKNVKNAYVRLRNDKTGKELCRMTFTDCGQRTALVMCKLYRFSPSVWKLKVIGSQGDGHTFDKTLKDVVPFLEKAPAIRTFEVRVHEAKELPKPTSAGINPYVDVRFDEKKEKSKVLKGTDHPKFDTTFIVKGEATAIEVNIFSRKVLRKRTQVANVLGLKKEAKETPSEFKKELVGRVSVPVPEQPNRISIGTQWYPLKLEGDRPAASGQIKISIAQVM